jgi:hypothetical protein
MKHFNFEVCGLATDKKTVIHKNQKITSPKIFAFQQPTFHSLFHEGYPQKSLLIHRKNLKNEISDINRIKRKWRMKLMLYKKG